MSPQSTILNEWSDFWFYKIGVNVIPANTKDKNTFESWSNWKDQPIPDEVHESRKKSVHYNNGIAIITGPLWRGPYQGKYLVAIDLDNKKAIDEFCGVELEYLKQHTLIEQTSNPEKAHIYFIVEREIPNKSSSKVDASTVEKIERNDIPALEVKSNSKGIMFCAASPHKNGSNYRIIGTLKPEVFSAAMVEERISRVCNNYNIPYGFDNEYINNSDSYRIPIEDLFKPETKIYEGENRHEAILRVMDALLSRNKGILTLEQIKKLSWERNQGLCIPPLDDIEMEKQWKCATNLLVKILLSLRMNTVIRIMLLLEILEQIQKN
jgi:Bifunctional DNA primase/polymerase, N-terminal